MTHAHTHGRRPSRSRHFHDGRWFVALVAASLVIACGGDQSVAGSPVQMRKTALSILNAPQEIADSATLDLDHFGPWQSRVSIEVPSARGAEPALALVYGSSGPNGRVGHGWRVTGLSTISAKSVSMGIAEGNQTDRYFLDGAELLPCTALNPSTPSCQAGGNYAFLDENYYRVMRWYGKKTGFAWSTWTPNGTESRYTAAGDVHWTQSEVIDRNGQRAVSSGTVDRIETVYNFAVEEDHDYFVGSLGAAVHNSSTIGKGAGIADDVFRVTPEGVTLPKGPKYRIPEGYVENPYRSGSYGEIVDRKFKERLRIDPATPPGQKGPNASHYHRDGKGTHYSPAPGDKDPGFLP